MNGQIQYGPARSLISKPTRVVRRTRRLADPARFSETPAASRSVALLFGGSLVLGALLAAVPRELPGIAVGTVLGGAWLSLVLAMTLPTRAERAGAELARRLGQFRDEVNAVGDEPTRDDLERLLRLSHELGLEEEEIATEAEHIRALLGALTLRDDLARGDLPIAASPDPLPEGDECHFVGPVRFGRRKSDQYGHLVLTSGWLKFRGTMDLSITWSEVGSVQRVRQEVIVAVQDSRRVLRFALQSVEEAARCGVIAEHLARAAHADEQRASEPQPLYQAAL